ncbi:MAG: transcriptional regulator with XRE-family HTH domain [Myxococcota bacterium]|jgi:transcriptional regulator with XRE-family HTH domain
MDTDSAARHLARNIRQLRGNQGLSQQKLADLSGVPRATWANLESGSANPTLAVLLAVSATLRVSVEELLSPPRTLCRLYAADSLTARTRSGARIRELLPDPLPGLQIERMALPAGCRFAGSPHTPGTREYLTCEHGHIALSVGGETWTLSPGDVLVFRGDQRHGYGNPGAVDAVGYSVVVLAPSGL